MGSVIMYLVINKSIQMEQGQQIYLHDGDGLCNITSSYTSCGESHKKLEK